MKATFSESVQGAEYNGVNHFIWNQTMLELISKNVSRTALNLVDFWNFQKSACCFLWNPNEMKATFYKSVQGAESDGVNLFIWNPTLLELI